MTPRPRPFSTFVVARSRLPLAMPKPSDVLGKIVAPHREAARAVARNLYPGLDVVVIDARAWPVETPAAEPPTRHPELLAPSDYTRAEGRADSSRQGARQATATPSDAVATYTPATAAHPHAAPHVSQLVRCRFQRGPTSAKARSRVTRREPSPKDPHTRRDGR